MAEERGRLPLVSVIVPMYNAGSTIERCMQSILGQRYPALEVLAVDDGSTDNSLALLREFEARDGRVRVLSQPNGGVSSARNLAIGRATGEYLQFVDSDDVLPFDATQSLVEALERGHDLAIAPYVEVMGGLHQKRGYLQTDMTLSQREFLDRLSAHPNSFYYAVLWNKLYRRELIERGDIRCDARLPWGEDFAFNTEYYQYVQSVEILSEPVYEYYRNVNGLALSTARACIAHPLRSIRVKLRLHGYYKRLYEATGLYEEYRRVLPQYLFKVTINN